MFLAVYVLIFISHLLAFFPTVTHNSCFKKSRMTSVLATPLDIQPREQLSGESWGLKKMKRWFSYHFCISCKAILHTNTSPISHQGGLPAVTKPREVNRLPLADCLAQASM